MLSSISPARFPAGPLPLKVSLTKGSSSRAQNASSEQTQSNANLADPYLKYGLVPTKNKMGWMAVKLEPISTAFVDFAKCCKLPVLDIGTAEGYVPAQLVSQHVKVIANDICWEHLDILFKRTIPKFKQNLTLDTKHFPDATDFPKNSLGAILVSRVFHFLSGEELELGAKKIFEWLAPGGKVFVYTCAPYRKNMMEFAQEFDEKKKTQKYPGLTSSLNKVNPAQGQFLKDIPFHYLDTEILARLFIAAGFKIERCEYISIDLPDDIKLDGRENVGLIAVKPLRSRL